MFVLEDVFFLGLLVALGVWGFLSSRTLVRTAVAAIYLVVIVFGVMDYEPTAAAIKRHEPRTAEFRAGVSEMLKNIRVFRPYILVAAIGLFALSIKRRGAPKELPGPKS